jgi:hypothetical protein
MHTTDHILAKEGILTTFSIAKKVTAKDVKKLRSKIKSAKMDADKLHELLRTSIIKDTQKDIVTQKIPGLIVGGIEDSDEKKRIMELTYFASMISKKLSEKNIDKYHSCYIINAIVNMLGLTEENFDEFHKQFSKFKDGEKPKDGADGGTEDNSEPPDDGGVDIF